MDPELEELAVLHTLGCLDEREAALFAAHMARSAELRERVAGLQVGLERSLLAAGREAPEPPEWATIARRLEAGNAASAPPLAIHHWLLRSFASPWAWAALLLLGLNLFLLSALQDARSRTLPASSAELSMPVSSAGAAVSNAVALASASGDVYSEIQRIREELRSAQELIHDREQVAAEIRRDLADALRQRDQLDHSFKHLAARFVPFFDGREGLSRFTVIELVDASPAQTGLPRRPFAALAEQFLTGVDNIGRTDPNFVVGPSAEGLAVLRGHGDEGRSGLMPLSLSDLAAAHYDPVAGELSFDADSTAAADTGLATGFTVWRDDEQKGFLDVYNLPEPSEGRVAHLWVRAGDLDSYVLVGAIPELENGNGSFFYSVEEEGFTPSEILITGERQEDIRKDPDFDNVLLRGP